MSKQNLFIILLVGFVDHLGIGLVYPIFATLLFDPEFAIVPEDASASFRGAMLGLMIGLTPLAQFFSSPLLGAFSDRRGRRIALSLGLGVGVLSYMIAVFGIWLNSLGLLFIYRLAVGFSDGTVAVAQASIADMTTEENRGKMFARFGASLGFGFTVGPFLGGKLGEEFGFAVPFMAAGAICFLNFILVYFKFPETRKEFKASSFNLLEGIQEIKKIFLWKPLRAFFVGGFALGFGWAFFNEFAPVLLRSRFSFTTESVGNYFAMGGIYFALSSTFLATFLQKRFSSKWITLTFLAFNAFSMMLYLMIDNPQHVWWILPPLISSLAVVFPTVNSVVSSRAGNRQGEVLGAFQAVLSAAMGLSPLLAGSLIGVYPELTAWGGAITMSIASMAFWVGFRSPYRLEAKPGVS